MAFTSFNFFIFFPALAIVYYITPAKYRWITLLVSGYFFYLNIKPVFALFVAGVTLSTYIFTRLIDKTEIESRKKALMQINIVLILLPLFFFKYFGDINNGMLALMESANLRWPLPEIKLILPIGISFYTFMAIGYTVDVYNEEIESEKNPGMVALFLSFFPLILSGPIERAKNMIPQFKAKIKIDYTLISQGLKLMLWGYFMKLVVADRLGIYVDFAYSNISSSNGISLSLASVFYSFQLYADFGGYSLIAVGVAKILGIDVMQNFNRPFFSPSMSEFWRRWHISLITWLTDYVYTPLSFSLRKYKLFGIVTALMITFMISGIWHGAALTIVVWGLLQGMFLSFEALTNNKKLILEKKYKLTGKTWYIFTGICFTFFLFSFSLIFGRAVSINDSLMIMKKIFTDFGTTIYTGDIGIFIFSLMGIFILLVNEFVSEFFPKFKLFNNKNQYVRFFSILLLIIYIVSFGVFDGGQFIYFKF